MDQSFQPFPERASQLAGSVDQLAIFILIVCTFFTLIIFLFIVYFALRYRRRSDKERPPKITGNATLEILWTAIPLALTVIMCIWGAKLYAASRQPPANAMEIFVIGKQWMWQIQHPEGRREINTLHIPLNRPIKLVMTSEDVIHDFAVPAFRVKQDVVPGIYTSEWFIPTRLGEYHLFCDQYCGAKHAEMIGTVVVCDAAQYERWLAGDPTDVPPRIAGEKLFTQYGCASCHGQYGPSLAGLFGSTIDITDETGRHHAVLADEAYLRESILYPSKKIAAGYANRMPSYQGSLSEEQMLDLIQYIKHMGANPATHPVDVQPTINNPPFSGYRSNP